MAERALAHIEEIAWIKPIDGADNIELAGVLGWDVIVKKEAFHVGDKCVFFEIDSKLPEREWSEFLRPKHFKIKTMKLGKFGVWSQGLALPVDVFPEFSLRGSDLNGTYPPVGTDVTELLGVRYSVEEDNIRKSKAGDPNAKYKAMAARHPNLAKQKWFRWMMKRRWGKRVLFFFLGKQNDNPKKFPSWISKTDEERIENCPWFLDSTDMFIVTEKLDGTSCSFGIHKEKNKWDFAVCSRNVRQVDRDQECYHDSNIYWELADKYDIKDVLIQFAEANKYDTVVLQGEGIGFVQGNPYKLQENDLYCFNLIIDGSRVGTIELKKFCDDHKLKCVPVLETSRELPHDMESMKQWADGMSRINTGVKREGLVVRSMDGKQSFKNVSREYLLKHNG